MYKLLLFDLDGTLLTEKREIDKSNLSTLQGLMKSGIKVGFATGRSLHSAGRFRDMLKPNGPLILFNGARVWDQQYIFQNNLSFDQAMAALRLVPKFDVHVNLYVENQILISKRTPTSIESEEKDGVPHRTVGPLHEWLAANTCEPVKIMLIGDPQVLLEFKGEFVGVTPKQCSLIHSEWN